MKVFPTVELGDVCCASTGTRDPRRSPQEPFIYVDIGAVDNQAKQITAARTLAGRDAPSRARKVIKAKDVIVSMTRPNLNAVAIVPEDLDAEICSTGFGILRATEKVLPEYLFHFVRSSRFVEVASGAVSGALYPAITEGFLRSISIPLPPLEEQRRIVDILNRAAGIERLRAQASDHLRALVPALFIKMFGDRDEIAKRYPCKPLREVAGIGSGATKGRRIDPAEAIEVPYLRVANVQDGYLNLDEIKAITIKRGEQEKYALLPGDLVMTEGGDPDKLGRAAIWKGQIDYCAHQNHVFRVRPNTEVVLTDYLREAVGSAYGKAYFLLVAKQTTGIASINKTQLGNFPVPVPPIDQQFRFRRFVAGASAVSQVSDSAADSVRRLNNSLMSRLFDDRSA